MHNATDASLDRFVHAQHDTYAGALAELKSGKKLGHWMWFVFPQLRGLGVSATSTRYGIADIAEAGLYLQHPVLGRRLLECTHAVLGLGALSLVELFGSPDELKFVSCMTLFSAVHEAPDAFNQALSRFNHGNRDSQTQRLLATR